jgi:hypothetical protein
MRIFQSSLTKLAQLVLPTRLRTSTISALLNAMVSPIEEQRSELLQKRQEVTYWLGITPQVCYLEKALNDNFDFENRRISVANGEGVIITLLHSNEALKPVIIGEDAPLIIHDNSNYSGGDFDFSVNIGSIALSQSEEQHMRYIINNNKLADKSYVILNQ